MTDRLVRTFARSFTSDLSLPQILEKLNELGPWTWIERDNDNYGEYISARVLADPHRGFFKIFVEPDHYVVNVLLESKAPDAQSAFDVVLDLLDHSVLPAIGARDQSEVDTYD